MNDCCKDLSMRQRAFFFLLATFLFLYSLNNHDVFALACGLVSTGFGFGSVKFGRRS